MKGVRPVNRSSAKSESPRHGKHVLWHPEPRLHLD